MAEKSWVQGFQLGVVMGSSRYSSIFRSKSPFEKNNISTCVIGSKLQNYGIKIAP